MAVDRRLQEKMRRRLGGNVRPASRDTGQMRVPQNANRPVPPARTVPRNPNRPLPPQVRVPKRRGGR